MRGTDRPDVGQGGFLAQLDRYPVTWGVVLANALVFSVAFSRQQGGLWIGPEVLDAMGALAWPELRAQPWRLLTAAFLHVDPLHLVLNVTAMHAVGRILEVHLGSARLWVLYVAFAILGGLASVGWLALRGGPLHAVGASNAVIGLLAFGWSFARGSRERLGSLEVHFGRWLLLVIGISLVLPGVDFVGHAGGALAGALAGFVVRPRPGDDPEPAWIPTAHALTILVLGAFGAAGRAS